MCGIYCVYKQSRSCQLPYCASPIFYFEIAFHLLLVSSLFVLCNVIVEDIVGLYTYTRQSCIVLCCDMYEEHWLTTSLETYQIFTGSHDNVMNHPYYGYAHSSIIHGETAGVRPVLVAWNT